MEDYKTLKLLSHLKIVEEIITVGDLETEKHKPHRYKSPIFLQDVDINNVLVSNKISSDEKTINTLLVTCMIMIKLSHYT